eukprot:scaffold4338_cov204-Skeletonema_menzelii.AAC.3
MFLWLVRSGEKKEKGEREERGATKTRQTRPDRPDQTRPDREDYGSGANRPLLCPLRPLFRTGDKSPARSEITHVWKQLSLQNRPRSYM